MLELCRKLEARNSQRQAKRECKDEDRKRDSQKGLRVLLLCGHGPHKARQNDRRGILKWSRKDQRRYESVEDAAQHSAYSDPKKVLRQDAHVWSTLRQSLM